MKDTVLEFIARLNAHDVDGMSALMSEDHTLSMRTEIRSRAMRK